MRIDMIGFRSGKLTVVAPAATVKKRAMWECRCDCGSHHVVMGKYLRHREVKSCGCLQRRPLNPEERLVHGHSVGKKTTPTYNTWASMVNRCVKKSPHGYMKYGAKGITVCDEWLTFKNFLKDMGTRPPGKTIDRIDNSKGYFPGNCRWATPKEQARNQSKNRTITFRGKVQCLSAWAEDLGMSVSGLHARLRKWTTEKAFTTPLKNKHRRA